MGYTCPHCKGAVDAIPKSEQRTAGAVALLILSKFVIRPAATALGPALIGAGAALNNHREPQIGLCIGLGIGLVFHAVVVPVARAIAMDMGLIKKEKT